MSELNNTEVDEITTQEEVVENTEATEEVTPTEETEVKETQTVSELEKLRQENAKLTRLLNKPNKKEEPKAEVQDTVSKEDFINLEIKSEGYKDKEEVQLIKDVMTRMGTNDVQEALNDEWLQATIKKNRDIKATEQATPSGNNRGGDNSGESPQKLLDKVNKGKIKYADLTKAQRDSIRNLGSGKQY